MVFIVVFASVLYGQGTCPTCDGDTVVVDEDVLVDFNQVDPNNYYSGEPDLEPYFSYDVSGATADTWKAIFNVGPKMLLIKDNATITVARVPNIGNNRYAPGIEIRSACELEVEGDDDSNGEPGQVVIDSLNLAGGDIVLWIDGDILIRGTIRSKMSGTAPGGALPGDIIIVSCCGDVTIDTTGVVQTIGVDPGGSDIHILTCCEGNNGDIVIKGLVEATFKLHAAPMHASTINIVSFDGAVTIDGNTLIGIEAGTQRRITSGVIVRTSLDPRTGTINIQAKNDITVLGNTVLVWQYQNFGAVATKGSSNGAYGGIISVVSLEGNIIASDRAFDNANRYNTFPNISNPTVTDTSLIDLRAYGNIELTATGRTNSVSVGGDPLAMAVVSTQGGLHGRGGKNVLRSYGGSIIVGDGVDDVGETAQVLANWSSGTGSNGLNLLTSCSGVTVGVDGQVAPADLIPSDDSGVCSPVAPSSLFNDCMDFTIECVCQECVPPVANLSGNPTSGCDSATVTFTDVSTGSPHTWSWSFPGGTPSSSNVQTPPPVKYYGSGSYSVTLTVTNDCGSDDTTATDYITVFTSPTATASSNSPVCEGDTIKLYGDPGGMASYRWTGPGGFSSSQQDTMRFNVTSGMAGDYILTVTDANGCTDKDTTTVMMNTKPTASASSTSPCEGDTIRLFGGPNGMIAYSWTGPGGFSSNSQDTMRADATLAMAGDYILTVTDVNGCKDSDTTTVTVYDGPVAVATSNLSVCEGDTIELYGDPNGMASYRWVGPGGFSSNSQDTIRTGATLAMAGDYILTVTDVNDCTAKDTTVVDVILEPEAVASSISPCEGDTIWLFSGPDGMDSYAWSGPNGFTSSQQSPFIPHATLAMSGTYRVIITGSCDAGGPGPKPRRDDVILANGTIDTAYTDVTVRTRPVATASSNSPVHLGETIELYGGPDGMDSYFWKGPNGWTSNQQNPTRPNATLSMAGIYSLAVSLDECHSDPDVELEFVVIDSCPPAFSWGDTCIDHELIWPPEDYMVGSRYADQDSYAVGFFNPMGVARLTSILFLWFDPGTIDLWIYLGRDDYCRACESLDQGQSPLGQLIGRIGVNGFIGSWMNWEEMFVDECIEIPAKTCFYVVWKLKEGRNTPRILGDAGHPESFSWIWNAELGRWKCFPGYEYMVEVCLDYSPGCIEIGESDITWSHPEHGLHPCVCEDYTVKAVFHSTCDTVATVGVEFYEAPWGLFTIPEGWPSVEPKCSETVYIPPMGVDTVTCMCGFHHHEDEYNWWARNIAVRWTRDMTFCCEEPEPTWYATRRCRMTIWPNKPWDNTPVHWSLAPIQIPVCNDMPEDTLEHELFVEVPDSLLAQGWSAILNKNQLILAPDSCDTVFLVVVPGGTEPNGPAMIKVRAFRCNGEWGEVEIEFMPYSERIDMQPIKVDSLQISRMYPCEDSTRFFIEFDLTNQGEESAYPVISYGMSQWGFFFPYFVYGLDTLSIGGLGTIDKAHYEDNFLLWFQEGRHFSRNVAIDYRVVKHHCYPVDSVKIMYYRDCRRVIWPGHRWPWEGEVIPIPVFNEEPFTDTIELAVVDSTVPQGWLYYWSRTSITLLPGMADTAYLSVIPLSLDPPLPPDHTMTVRAVKGFCDRDTGYVSIEFLPFACLCIPDYLGKVVENLPGREPSLVPGDTVFVSLMLENDLEVTGVQLDLIYNPQYLEPDTTWLTDRTSGMQLIQGTISPGLYHILIDFTPPPHPVIEPSPPQSRCEDKYAEEVLKIATVPFLIIDTPVPGTCSNIYLQDVIVTGLPDLDGEPKDQICSCYDHGQICFGGYVWPMKCDVTGDTSITLVDLFRILKHIIRKEILTGPVGTPGTPLWSADANGDEAVNILDLMKCINKSIGRYDPKVSTSVASVSVPGEMEVLENQEFEVPVGIDIQEPVAGVLYRMRYNSDLINIEQPALMERGRSMTLEWGAVGDEVWMLIYTMSEEVIEAGEGALVRVPFEVSGSTQERLEVLFEETIIFLADERIVFADPAVMILKAASLVPVEFSLSQNYPNPFNPVTEIRYGLPEDIHVCLEVFNLLGQRVITLVDEKQEAGFHRVKWDAGDMASGVYFYRIKAGDFTATRRMVLMK
jgi:PKD repeat protein